MLDDTDESQRILSVAETHVCFMNNPLMHMNLLNLKKNPLKCSHSVSQKGKKRNDSRAEITTSCGSEKVEKQ